MNDQGEKAPKTVIQVSADQQRRDSMTEYQNGFYHGLLTGLLALLIPLLLMKNSSIWKGLFG